MLCLHVYMCTECMSGALRDLKSPDPLALGLQWLWAIIQLLKTKPRSSAKTMAPNHSNSCSLCKSQITPKAILFHQNSEDHYQSLSLQHKPVTNHEHTTCFSQRPARSCFLDLPHQVPTSSVILTSQHLTICARNGSLTMRKHIVCICLSQVISLSQWSPAQFIYYKWCSFLYGWIKLRMKHYHHPQKRKKVFN